VIPERAFNVALWAGLLTFALIANAIGETYWVTLATRAICFAVAAVGLNLILGYGGLVSFGHAAFFGLGGYAVGILATHAQTYTPMLPETLALAGTQLMPVTWAVAVVLGGLAALLIGLLTLRTSGAYFIMITLAFGQMFYYFAIAWTAYGGEDGMSIYVRGTFPGVNTLVPLQFFLLCFGVLTTVLLLVWLLNRAPFGLSLNAARQSPERVETVGIPLFRLRLAAFVISGMITALAGALFADLNRYVSPAMFSWTYSGEFIVFIIIGGIARLMGPVVGACVFVTLEATLGQMSEYWLIFVGALLLLIVLFAKKGLVGLVAAPELRHGPDSAPPAPTTEARHA
jgi:branched-chain amino acid transport system permease protein